MALPVVQNRTLPAQKIVTRPAGDHPLGTAGWLEFPEGSPGYKTGDFWLSRLPNGQPIGFRDDGHILVCSGTRGGKGASYIIPNLCLWSGSVVVIDPKGESAVVTARRRGNGSICCRGMGQKVRIIDPFDVVKTEWDDFSDLKTGFNPLDMLDVGNDRSPDLAGSMVEALSISEGTKDYWNIEAQDLTKAVTLHLVSSPAYTPRDRNLVTVRKLLVAGDQEMRRLMEMGATGGDLSDVPSGLQLLLAAMKRNPAFGGMVSDAGERFSNLEKTSPRTMAGVIAMACANTSFIDSLPMRRCLSHSGFSLKELKADPKGVSLYLSLPQNEMPAQFRWLRLMLTLVLSETQKSHARPACGHPVLMVLDEFAGLGRMRVVENAAAQIAGFGAKMMFVVQALAQLKDTYKEGWETFVANASIKLFFCNDDHFTRDYISKLIGEYEVRRDANSGSTTHGTSTTFSNSTTVGYTSGWNSGSSASSNSGPGGGSFGGTSSSGASGSKSVSYTSGSSSGKSRSDTSGWSESVHKRLLLTPDEVGRLFSSREHPAALALISGYQPLRLMRTWYFRDQSFGGLYDPHPAHLLPPTLRQREIQRALDRAAAEKAARIAAEQQRAAEALRLLEAAQDEVLRRANRLFEERQARDIERYWRSQYRKRFWIRAVLALVFMSALAVGGHWFVLPLIYGVGGLFTVIPTLIVGPILALGLYIYLIELIE